MIKPESAKRRKFAHEILGLIGISALIALIVFLILTGIAFLVAERYCFMNNVPMTEFDWMEVERWILGLGTLLSVLLFCILFLALLKDRLTYIHKITDGIDAMREGKTDCPIPLEGNNELTELADSINYMSAVRKQITVKERALAQEKEQLIRSLSHDIRTPLTSILAYSEYLAEEEIPPEEQKNHLRMIRKKAEQIRDLTDILLDGSRRKLEYFADARLLMEQLAEEFEAELEAHFSVRTDLSGCGKFSGTFDLQELRRIFDNLRSNVCKYAEPSQPVLLTACIQNSNLVIRQTNTVNPNAKPEDSYRLGINSIRRIAQHYDGSVHIRQDDIFEITVILSGF